VKLKFLCGNHRRWLLENPGAAFAAWRNASDYSARLLEAGRLTEAANHAGCALETSDILLRHAPHPSRCDISRFSQSAIHLAHLLMALHEEASAHAVLQEGLRRVQGMLHLPISTGDAMEAVERLTLAARQLQTPAGAPPGVAVH
jgi:hypothetical protein